MRYQVKIVTTHTMEVSADNRFEALRQAKRQSKYRTELESFAQVLDQDGAEWTVKETPVAIIWQGKE
jgi:hypothetical protein